MKELGDYLHHLRLFDQATTNNEMNNVDRFRDLEQVVTYFKTLKELSRGLLHQLAVHKISVEDRFVFRFLNLVKSPNRLCPSKGKENSTTKKRFSCLLKSSRGRKEEKTRKREVKEKNAGATFSAAVT